MGKIEEYTDKIKNARYARDVRSAIVGGIKQCYQDSNGGFFKGTVNLISDLPTTNNVVNDTYYVKDVKARYSWNGTEWTQSGMSEAQYTHEFEILKDTMPKGDRENINCSLWEAGTNSIILLWIDGLLNKLNYGNTLYINEDMSTLTCNIDFTKPITVELAYDEEDITDTITIPVSNISNSLKQVGTITNHAELIGLKIFKGENDQYYITNDRVVDYAGKQISELKGDLDNLINNVISIDKVVAFENGGLVGGEPATQNYRVHSELFTAKYDYDLIIADGFRIGIHEFSNGIFSYDYGWKYGKFKIPKGMTCKLTISRITEDTSEVADINEFTRKITFLDKNGICNNGVNGTFNFIKNIIFGAKDYSDSSGGENYVIASSVYLKKDTYYTISCIQMTDVLSVRNTFNYKLIGGSAIYENATENYNVEMGFRSYTFKPSANGYYELRLWVNNATGEVTYKNFALVEGKKAYYELNNEYLDILEQKEKETLKYTTILKYADFYNGTLLDATPTLTVTNRVYSDIINAKDDICISVEKGFRVLSVLLDNGNYVRNSGWRTGTFFIRKGTSVRLIIARETEVSENANINEFCKALKLKENVNFFNCGVYSNSREKFVMHRGIATETEPSNTVGAFENAGKKLVYAIETDIRETSDGYFICMHDGDVSTTTNGSGQVDQLTYEYIKSLKVKGTEYQVPSFDEYLSVCKAYSCVPMVEIKGIKRETSFRNVYETLKKYGFANNSFITCSIYVMPWVRNITDEIPLVYNLYSPLTNYQTALNETFAFNNIIMACEHSDENIENIFETFHDNNIGICEWTVNTQTEAKEWFSKGCDLITSDSVTSVIAN